jgi:cytochrome d ubiquinol oxidase subunit II
MSLAEVPLVFVLAGLVFYAVLGGADFGAGFWQLTAGSGPDSKAIRDHAHHALGPVWEANHVWLIFVFTVLWTAYPVVFASIASTLSIPLFVAGIGIIFRGVTYALRSGTRRPSERRAVDTVFSVASVLTPFALGTVAGGVASLRVPPGNAAGSEITSWANSTSILIGAMAVVVSAYMAAVFLAGDAVRLGEPKLEQAFRRRALLAGLITGAIAFAGLLVVHSDAHRLFHRLVEGRGLPALAVSATAGVATLVLVWRRRYEPARFSAAVAVAAIIAGWTLAQSPLLLRGLTVKQAAAPHDALVAVTVAVVAGGVILFPALAFLFRLVLGGHFDRPALDEPAPAGTRRRVDTHLLARAAAACLVAGIGLLTIAEAPWAHGAGIAFLVGFIVLGFPAAVPLEPSRRSG